MSVVVQIFEGKFAAPDQPQSVRRTSRLSPIHHEQIQSLVQQLFFQPESGSVRHAAFSAADDSINILPLCFEIAEVLSDLDSYDIGVIDANPHGPPLENKLGLGPIARAESPRHIRARLWLVPRESWMPAGAARLVTEQDMSRLQALTAKFDFSILCCPPLSCVTARIGRACEGVVLVLAANKTRRLVAREMRDYLRSAQVPLLGTVLTERRFPVPLGLYRSL